MRKKILISENSLKAKENLQPYFEEIEKRRANGFPHTIPYESPFLSFLEPLLGKTPQNIHLLNGEFVIGNVAITDYAEKHYHSKRVGVWNAATGKLEFEREGAVSMEWTPNFAQIGVWVEYYVADSTLSKSFSGSVRSEWHWRFERWDWQAKKLISTCEFSNGGLLWSVYLEFPKKYKGRIARLYCRHEEGGESIFILCDDENGDRELSNEEMSDIRKSTK